MATATPRSVVGRLPRSASTAASGSSNGLPQRLGVETESGDGSASSGGLFSPFGLVVIGVAAAAGVSMYYQRQLRLKELRNDLQQRPPPLEDEIAAHCSGNAILTNAAYLSASERAEDRQRQADELRLSDCTSGVQRAVVAVTTAARRAWGAAWRRAISTAVSPVAAATAVSGSEMVLEITEFVELPDDTNTDIMEVCLPLRGEIRLSTFMDRTLTAVVFLSNNTAGEAAARAGATAASLRSEASFQGAVVGAIPSVRDAPSLAGVQLNDMIDTERFSERRGSELRFTPARVESSLLMTYNTTTAEEISPAVVAREATVTPGTTAGAFVLTVVLECVNAAQDVCVEVVIPKRATLCQAPDIAQGRWGRPSGAPANELQWEAGDVRCNQVLECVWQYAIAPETYNALSRSSTPFVPPSNESSAAGAGRPGSPMTGRGRTAVPPSESSLPWDALIPHVSISYAAPSSSSGMKIRKILFTEPVCGGGNGGAAAAGGSTPATQSSMRSPTSALTPRGPPAGSSGATPPAGGDVKASGVLPFTTASYRTMYSQRLRVRPIL